MPKQGSRAEVNSFVKGLITEASPLNFPANASLDEANFELLRDGTRKRRLGLKRIPSSPSGNSPSLLVPNAHSSNFIWEGAGGNTNTDFLVLQLGNSIAIHRLGSSNIAAQATYVTQFEPSSAMSFASVNGRLIVTAGYNKVLLITYNNTDFSYEYQSILVRDSWGVEAYDSQYNEDAHAGTISMAEIYNFYNQSWGIPRRSKPGDAVNPLKYYIDNLNASPTPKEVVWTALAYVPQTGTTDPYEAIYLNLFADRYGSGISASKGYFIIDLLARGDSRAQRMEENYIKYPSLTRLAPTNPNKPIPTDTSLNGAKVVTEFSGRVFYAGFNGSRVGGDKRSPTLNNYVCFSQLVKSDSDVVKCYQAGDPTSRDDSEVVETDGGFIRISGARDIIAMRNLGTSLIIFADNGVWSITGGNDYGFSATNFKVDKISDFGCIGPDSVITDNSSLLFWGADAIYAVVQSQTGQYKVDDITRESIQTRYNSIPLNAKKNVKGVFDLFAKKLRWVYNQGVPFTNTTDTHELVFDLTLKAFYINNLNTVSDYSYNLVTPIFYASNPVPLFYLNHVYGKVLGTVSYEFVAYSDKTFRDWKDFDGVGVDAKAYMLTGAMLAGDSAVDKQTPYILTHMRPTETGATEDGVPINPSSCLLRAQWDWSNNINSNKFGTSQEVYGYRHPNFTLTNDGYDVTTTKRKLRGKGKAISLYFETQPDKDCQLLGWSLTINGNAIA